MANIESHPEGFNALRRMYENFQEPLMNAATGQGSNQQDPLAALLGSAGANAHQPAAGIGCTPLVSAANVPRILWVGAVSPAYCSFAWSVETVCAWTLLTPLRLKTCHACDIAVDC